MDIHALKNKEWLTNSNWIVAEIILRYDITGKQHSSGERLNINDVDGLPSNHKAKMALSAEAADEQLVSSSAFNEYNNGGKRETEGQRGNDRQRKTKA